MPTRKPYPTDVSEEEWAFVAPYLALVRADAPQRVHDLREVFDALRWVVCAGVRGSALAHAAARLPALGGRIPADAKVARSRGVRGHGPRPARGTPLGSRQGGSAPGRPQGQPNPA